MGANFIENYQIRLIYGNCNLDGRQKNCSDKTIKLRHSFCSEISKNQFKSSVKYPGTIKVLQFPPNLLIQGSRCKTLIQGPTIGAPSKYRGGPSLGREKQLKGRIQD